MAEHEVLHLGLTLGANEIGTLISSVFLGITTVQMYIYYKNDFRDPLWIRLLVSLIWVLETTHTVFIWIYLYSLTVTNYGNPAALVTSPWTLSMSSVFDGLIGGAVQAYFAHRIYILSGHLLLPIISWLGSALQVALTLSIAIIGSRMTLREFASRFEWIVTTSLVAIMVVDILNTGGLCYFLFVERSKNRVKRTRLAVDKLILWTIETGLVTSVAAVVMLILFLGKPGTALWISITLFYAKLYSNCLLASLNGRISLRANRNVYTTSSGALEVSVTQDTVGSHTLADLSRSGKDTSTKGYDYRV
jgi:hypothetical protein